MAHDEGEANPWHIGARSEVLGDGVGAASANEEGHGAIPEVEEADKVEGRDAT